jgi:hypothetical protein
VEELAQREQSLQDIERAGTGTNETRAELDQLQRRLNLYMRTIKEIATVT